MKKVLVTAGGVTIIGLAAYLFSPQASSVGGEAVPDEVEYPLGSSGEGASSARNVPEGRAGQPKVLNSPGSASFRVNVRDEGGGGLAGASVFLRSFSGSLLLGASGDDGSFVWSSTSIDAVVGDRGRVLVECDGYCPSSVALSECAVSEGATVTLDREWMQHGVVLDPMGLAVGEGFAVIAARTDLKVVPALDSLAGRSDGWVTARTGRDGRFQLRGLDPSREYLIYACGPGFIPVLPHSACVSYPTDSEVVLSVAPLYGCRFVIDDVSGRPLRTSEFLSNETGFLYRKPRGMKLVSSDSGYPQFAGVPSTLLEWDRPHSFTVLVTPREGSAAGSSVDGIGFRLELPGYHPVEFTARAALTSESLPEYKVSAIPIGPAWGRVDLRIGGFPAFEEGGLAQYKTAPAFGVFYLSATAGPPFAIAIPHDSRGKLDVSEVPVGRYFGWFRDAYGLIRSPPRGHEMDIEVKADRATRIEIDLPPFGQVRFPDQAGTYNRMGELGFELSGMSAGRPLRAKRTVYFESIPATIAFLPVGDYSLTRVFGYASLGGGMESVQFSIRSGEVAIIPVGARE